MKKDLNELAKEVHQANIKWWQNIETGEPIERNQFELLALIVSEISECLEGERKTEAEKCPHCEHHYTNYRGLCMEDGHIWLCPSCQLEHVGSSRGPVVCMDDKLPHRKMAEVELADAKIRILDFAAGFGFKLETVLHLTVVPNKGEALFKIMESIVNSAHGGLPSRSKIMSYAIADIEAYATFWGYDIDGAFTEKMSFNASREDHKHEARRIAGGKQF